jgi:hypothetical protein
VVTRLAALLAALPLVAGAVACEAKPTPLPPRTTAQMLTALGRARTARAGVSVDVQVNGVTAMLVTARGDIDFGAGRSAVRVEYDLDGREAGFVTSDEVVDGDTFYLSKPGGTWFRCTATAGGVRPYEVVNALSRVATLTRVGEEKVRGTPTLHYKGTTEGGLIKDVEVWARRDGMPLRVVGTYEGVTVTTSVDLDGFGEPAPLGLPATSKPLKDVDAVYKAVKES